MSTGTFRHKLMATGLSLLLVSCSTARPMTAAQGPAGPHELARYALLVHQAPDGRVTHEWKPLDELDLTSFSYPVSARNGYRNTVCASSSGLAEYCEGRRKQCEDDCLRSSRPFSIGHLKYTDTKIQPWRIARSWWCPRYCLEQSIACNKGRGEWAEQYAAEFDEIEPAVDWIKNHREEILVGTVIVIAGVAFTAAVVATSGGALILVPLVLMAENSPGALPVTQLAESTR